ncbi:MAG: hypothetical protein B7Y45_07595 [Sphingomonas sp. 28-66-16]|nr:MAG: hypothetical protein B7Y45_07595 [Sphingomonas sp. 28-66-16]
MAVAWIIRLLIMLLAGAALLPAPSIASGMAGDVGKKVDVCVARVAAGQTASSVFAGRVPLDCRVVQHTLGAGDFWALSQPVRLDGDVAVRSGSLWQKRKTVFGLYADGAIVAVSDDVSRNLQLGAILLDRLPARPAPLVRVLWRIEGVANLRGILIGPRLATMRESGWSNLRMAAIYSGFAGMCIALLCYNLALWGAIRHRFQLAYCLMVAMLLVYAFSSSGALAWAWPEIANNDRLRINYLTLGLVAATAMLFARSFFEERVFAGWASPALWAIAAALVATSLAFALLAPWHIVVLERLYLLSLTAMIVSVPVLLLRARHVGSRYLWLFVLAWGAPVVFAGIRIANSFGLVGWSFWVDNSTLFAMTAEALLSSFAIAYRIRLLSNERDEARLQELAARALAETDSLTGLLNRRAFLSRAIGRTGDQLLLITDIDHFKAVNETIGHDGGDEVLRVFARALRASVPADALVARIGGEEFAIVTPIDRSIEPEDVLARLRAERMPFDLSVTASIGACTGPLASEIDWKKLYRRADRALYEAKAQGRDRVRHGLRAA